MQFEWLTFENSETQKTIQSKSWPWFQHCHQKIIEEGRNLVFILCAPSANQVETLGSHFKDKPHG